MLYLVEQLFWFLLIALIVGIVVGWITYKPEASSSPSGDKT